MQPGFHAVAGATFSAFIEGCTVASRIDNDTSAILTETEMEQENTTINLVLAEERKKREYLTLYPNPTRSLFTIDGSFDNYTIQVITAHGILHQELVHQNPPVQIDLGHLPSGLYFVRAYNNSRNTVFTKRILKKD